MHRFSPRGIKKRVLKQNSEKLLTAIVGECKNLNLKGLVLDAFGSEYQNHRKQALLTIKMTVEVDT